MCHVKSEDFLEHLWINPVQVQINISFNTFEFQRHSLVLIEFSMQVIYKALFGV